MLLLVVVGAEGFAEGLWDDGGGDDVPEVESCDGREKEFWGEGRVLGRGKGGRLGSQLGRGSDGRV